MCNRKSAAKSLLDLALLMANASQLKYTLTTNDNPRFRSALLALIFLSILLQIAVAIMILRMSELMKYTLKLIDQIGLPIIPLPPLEKYQLAATSSFIFETLL